ncbi:MAG: 2-amino-4-hydroxy-6-hydroxymethyldihydropteridine diphosphokinase [Acidobacteria bacterium]|nr:2-amino-4-hydroxy-6-hydroxymethyldihydropteridine diphosphokinase [Acidobacteriota bacterium]
MTELMLAFGSNVGDRVEQIQEAVNRLSDFGLRCNAISSCYESKAVGLTDQPDYINAAGLFNCDFNYSPFEVLKLILSIETEMGRVRTIEKGPRKIDIDLIFFGHSLINTNNLIVPHESFSVRRFVLEPLCELIPDFQPPGAGGRDLSRLLQECPDMNSSPANRGKCLTILS